MEKEVTVDSRSSNKEFIITIIAILGLSFFVSSFDLEKSGSVTRSSYYPCDGSTEEQRNCCPQGCKAGYDLRSACDSQCKGECICIKPGVIIGGEIRSPGSIYTYSCKGEIKKKLPPPGYPGGPRPRRARW